MKWWIVLLSLCLLILSGCDDDNDDKDSINIVELNYTASYPLNIAEPSGLAYDGTNLWTVSDEGGLIYKMDLEGTILDTIDTELRDLEGIGIDTVSNVLWLADESDSKLYGLSIGDETIHTTISFSPVDLEGACYNKVCYAVVSKSEPMQVLIWTQGAIEGSVDYALDFAPSGIDRGEDQDTYYIISDETHCIYHWNTENGIVESWKIKTRDPEGIAVVGNTAYVVDDSENRLDVYILN